MKFTELPYSRVTLEDTHAAIEKFLSDFASAGTAEAAAELLRGYFALSTETETNMSLAQVRYEINTKDEFYKAENDYYDENSPAMQLDEKRVTDALLDSPLRGGLEDKFGSLMFRMFENRRKLLNEASVPLMREENKLTSKYSELLGGAEIEFDGKTLNLSQLGPYRQSSDRAVRKSATAAYFGWFAARQAEFDELFAKLTVLRDEIAKNLGFASGVEYGYAKMQRFDYDEAMVKTYRDDVKKYLVPLVSELKLRQQKRIGVDKLRMYDNDYYFKSGNPKPFGTPDEMVAHAKKMYHELSPETGEFFDFMLEGGMMDLLAKPGKAPGGFCTAFPKYKTPFIFSNFNGTKDDVDVLTHEAGHAFQVYLSMREIDVPLYWWPTYESCEIHSMSMELITRPWMNGFFGADTEKFLYLQLEDILNFIPYGCLVDDFQHHVYRNPSESPDERAAAWLTLERGYMPWLDYDGDAYLESGRRWQRQSHIFSSPFYYIDYTLAQNCAVQFFLRFENGDKNAWGDYLELCKTGGSETFVKLVEIAGLRSPFEADVLKNVCADLHRALAKTDDAAIDK